MYELESIIPCQSFPSEDGHIESILIGADTLKLSFQTWNSRQLILIFEDIEEVVSCNAVYGDIGEYREVDLGDGRKQYLFYSSWSDETESVLSINAGGLKIYQVGENGGINSALFDVGYDYIGNQDICEYRDVR